MSLLDVQSNSSFRVVNEIGLAFLTINLDGLSIIQRINVCLSFTGQELSCSIELFIDDLKAKLRSTSACGSLLQTFSSKVRLNVFFSC